MPEKKLGRSHCIPHIGYEIMCHASHCVILLTEEFLVRSYAIHIHIRMFISPNSNLYKHANAHGNETVLYWRELVCLVDLVWWP